MLLDVIQLLGKPGGVQKEYTHQEMMLECTVGGAPNPTIISIVNTCGGGSGTIDDGGMPSYPNPFPGDGASGGGYDTTPYSDTEAELIEMNRVFRLKLNSSQLSWYDAHLTLGMALARLYNTDKTIQHLTFLRSVIDYMKTSNNVQDNLLYANIMNFLRQNGSYQDSWALINDILVEHNPDLGIGVLNFLIQNTNISWLEFQPFFNFFKSFTANNSNVTWQQLENWFIKGQLDYQNSLDVAFAGDLSALSHDLLIANQNGTLNQLQASWPNWEKVKQNIKNSIAHGVHQTAKIVKTYYDEVSSNPYTNNAATRVVLNTYIDALRNEIKQATNMNKDTMNWQDLFNIWLFELMPNPYSGINFTWSSNVINGNTLYNSTTNAVYKFPKGEPDMMNDVKNGLNNGSLNVGDSITRYFHYNFTQYYATLSNQNVGIQMLGSYPTKATVISKSGNSAVIRFYIYNILGWDSGTRFVQTNNGTIGVIPNKEIGEGLHLGGNLINTYTWEEVIVF
ncbi:hypothetical protein [Chryseobacterium lineare]